MTVQTIVDGLRKAIESRALERRQRNDERLEQFREVAELLRNIKSIDSDFEELLVKLRSGRTITCLVEDDYQVTLAECSLPLGSSLVFYQNDKIVRSFRKDTRSTAGLLDDVHIALKRYYGVLAESVVGPSSQELYAYRPGSEAAGAESDHELATL